MVPSISLITLMKRHIRPTTTRHGHEGEPESLQLSIVLRWREVKRIQGGVRLGEGG